MKLSDWARANGVSYKTAWLWWKHGKLPVPARQLPTGTILVDVPTPRDSGAVLYARVACSEQKPDLDRQVAHMATFAAEQGIRVAKVIAEVGSGFGGHRKGLVAVLRSPEYGTLVVEHRDRLARFGSEYIEAALAASGRRLVVVDPAEVTDDLAEDMIDGLTRMCARLYGRQSARRRAETALKAAAQA